ncbi:hypothetical protein [Catenulispora acidiphila]|nr:hypothetical protein [Catenulispora acidiphila]
MERRALSFDEWPDGVGEVVTGDEWRAFGLVNVDLGEARLIEHLSGRVAG